MDRREYRTPPIDEALCEIRFASGSRFDLVANASFYEQMMDEYPGAPEFQTVVPLMSPPPTALGPITIPQEAQKTLFPDNDHRRILGLAHNLLSVHVLRPYPGWADFRAQILKAFSAYRNALKPNGVARIAVRYINKFTIPENDPVWEWLKIAPSIPGELSARGGGLVVRSQVFFNETPAQAVITLAGTEPGEPGSRLLVFDIDVHQSWDSDPLSHDDFEGAMENLRGKERDVFESLITDHARKRFNEPS